MLRKAKSLHPKIFVDTALKSIFFTFLWIPVYLTRCFLIKIISKCKPSYGKILDHFDLTLEEDYWKHPPKNSLVFTLVLEGEIRLQELKSLFTEKILEAKISNKKTGQDDLRYPEFHQYQTDFAGYKFWKNDPAFSIENHFSQKSYNSSFKTYSRIHQDYLNKIFPEGKSPWELVMVTNYLNSKNKTLLIFRAHHTLGDTKSLLKVLVEGLAEKRLKLPEVHYGNANGDPSILDKIRFYFLLPFYFVYVQVLGRFVFLKGDENPWKWKGEERTEEPLLNVAISKQVSLSDVKKIAKKHHTTASAVIMASVAGGVAKSDSRQTRQGLPCQWVLPKPNHPDKLANHSFSGTMDLPTDTPSPLERLRKCDAIFYQLKTSSLHMYDQAVLFQLGTWFNPLRSKFMENKTFPVIVTNIASDGEGFEIAKRPCSQFTMTCAPNNGACGIIISLFSYKDKIEMTATSKRGIFTEAQTHKIVDLIANEVDVLKAL